MNYNYPKIPLKRKLTEKDKRDIQNLKDYYANYFQILDKCVKENYIYKDKAVKIKISLARKCSAEIFLIPHYNRIFSRAESIISEGLEKVFKNN